MVNGSFFRLYDLAAKHARVIELLNKLLSQVITAPPIAESRRDRLQRQAVAIAKRYKSLGKCRPQLIVSELSVIQPPQSPLSRLLPVPFANRIKPHLQFSIVLLPSLFVLPNEV
jgi:hypothetical protein